MAASPSICRTSSNGRIGVARSSARPGLGLYISRQVVELHGGQIQAASPPEVGARLTIVLPTRPPQAEALAG